MGDRFNWQFDESPSKRSLPDNSAQRPSGAIRFWVAAILLTILLIGSWALVRRQQVQNTRELITSVQDTLDLMVEAVDSGDGELFFAMQEDDPAWLSAQLLPTNLDFYQANPVISNSEQYGALIHANATWYAQDQQLQRVLFFESRSGMPLRQVATSPTYWGTTQRMRQPWGTLVYRELDAEWRVSIATFINDEINKLCAANCLAHNLPLTVEIRSDFSTTAAPGLLAIPSPRLLGLDSLGAPSDLFWHYLRRQVKQYLTPATIRFAIPAPDAGDGQTILPYRELAEQFMAQHPAITIDIVQIEPGYDDFFALARDFDGAAFVPSEELLAAGHVFDLTDFIISDPDFDQQDYYEQIWQGALWNERVWFMPEAAEMHVLYYDKAAYEGAGHPQPPSRWTWEEMARDVSSLVADQTEPGPLAWGYLDVGLDTLFSYAFNWNNQCREAATVFCQTPLRTENVAAALDWYSQMVGQPGTVPDVTGKLENIFSQAQLATMGMLDTLPEGERRMLLLLNFQGSRRKAAVWVDSPLTYEFNLLLAPVGIASFPGSDRFDGITPLWLRGSFISQHSDQPLAVWQWLKFLSQQTPSGRYIPARPSVAAQTGFWTKLPRALGDVLRTAFPFARPVTIADQSKLTWDQVRAVVSGASSAAEAAQSSRKRDWFADLPAP